MYLDLEKAVCIYYRGKFLHTYTHIYKKRERYIQNEREKKRERQREK